MVGLRLGVLLTFCGLGCVLACDAGSAGPDHERNVGQGLAGPISDWPSEPFSDDASVGSSPTSVPLVPGPGAGGATGVGLAVDGGAAAPSADGTGFSSAGDAGVPTTEVPAAAKEDAGDAGDAGDTGNDASVPDDAVDGGDEAGLSALPWSWLAGV
jgi:hypothetical protein